ncbi:MAG: hypothetical protein ABW352_13415 [Polyangiales bacterium]
MTYSNGLLVSLLLLCACSSVDAGSEGRLIVRANGGVETREGIARERFADGYLVKYTHAVLSVSAFHLRTRDGDDAVVVSTPTVVDLVPSSAEVFAFDGVPSQRWDEVGFQSHAVQPGVRNVNAPGELVQRMQERGYSFLQTGTLTAPDGMVIPFELGHAVDIDYFTCTAGDGTYGVVVPVNGTAEAEITWHLTHLWFDSFAEDSAFRAEAIAAVHDGSSPVTMEQLASQPLGTLRDRTGKPLRDGSGNPVIYIPPQELGVTTLRDFVVRARFGHFNGLEGSCETEVRVR